MTMIASAERPQPVGLPSATARVRAGMPARWWRAAARSAGSSFRTWWHGLLLLILGAGWGLQFTLLKISVDARLDELGILAGSMTLLAALYALLLTCRRDWFRPSWRRLRFFLISSTLGFVVPLGCVILAARHLPAGLIVLHESLTPICIVVLALAIRSEPVSLRRRAAIALGMAAVLLVLWPELLGLGGHRPIGLLFALLIPIAYGTDAIYVAARWPDGLSCVQVITGELIGAALLSLPLFLIAGEPIFISAAPTIGGMAVLAFVVVTFVETYLYFHLLRTAGAVFISVASFIALFAGILWGMALNGESHPASVWLAVVLVVLALGLIGRRSSDEPTASAP
jgi:drug/metabolite transporter (DMT)-like permease